eukprot:324652-Pleurochrysis_carterae.AAC.1
MPPPPARLGQSRGAERCAAVDAEVAVLEVVRILVGLEKQRMQLQHVACGWARRAQSQSCPGACAS